MIPVGVELALCDIATGIGASEGEEGWDATSSIIDGKVVDVDSTSVDMPAPSQIKVLQDKLTESVGGELLSACLGATSGA